MKVAHIKILLVSLFLGLFCSVNAQAQEEFGWIDISSTSESSGANLYIDGEFVTMVPAKVKVSTGKHAISVRKSHYVSYEREYDIKKDKTLCLLISLKASGKVVTLTTEEYIEVWIDNKFVGNGSWTGFLEFGKHTIDSRLPGCYPTTMEIDFDKNSDSNYTLPIPKKELGSLNITSSVDGAVVKIDGKVYGRTPLMIVEKLTIGKHYLEVTLSDKVLSREVDVTQGIVNEVFFDFSSYREVQINSKPQKSQLTINGEIVGNTPYTSYLQDGDYSITLNAKNYRLFNKNIRVSSADNTYSYKLKRQYIKPSCFYMSGEYQFLGLNGIKGSIGGFIKNVNIEANLIYSFNTSETVYWYIPNEMDVPYGYTYKPMYYGARLGYGFIIGNRLRITPQIGGGLVTITGSVVEEGVSDPKASNGYCATGVVGLRIDFAVAPSVAICITPNYSMPLVKSSLYSQIFDTSSTFKEYVSGFAASAGVCFFF